MKTKLHYIIITLITGLLLSSCANKMSLMKRKYNKGYYVSHTHKTKTNKHEEPVVLAKKENAIKSLQVSTAEPELKYTSPITEKAIVLLPVEDKTVAKKPNSHPVSTALAKHTFKTIQTIAPKKMQQQIAKKIPGDGGLIAATLSLFWIVLVVILIVYLFGVVFDGFGLGWAIHLLAVIFLVLLILWLLGAV